MEHHPDQRRRVVLGGKIYRITYRKKRDLDAGRGPKHSLSSGNQKEATTIDRCKPVGKPLLKRCSSA
tara:strand:- start:754 stop:954 length:201 start_codon:yes stop_codon:yes gene_type:complete